MLIPNQSICAAVALNNRPNGSWRRVDAIMSVLQPIFFLTSLDHRQEENIRAATISDRPVAATVYGMHPPSTVGTGPVH